MMSLEFIKRILSSIILLPFTFFIIVEGSFIFITFITICLFMSIFEWNNMSKKKRYNKIGFIFLFFSFLCIYDLRINEATNLTTVYLAFGLGYKFNDKYSLEIRQQTPRQIGVDSESAYVDSKSLSIIFGYTLF